MLTHRAAPFVAALLLALPGCAPTTSATPARASTVFTPALVASRLACRSDEVAMLDMPPEERRALASPLARRPPSELMVEATDDFDDGAWSAAIAKYWRVVRGDGDDDPETLGRAELRIAVAHMRAGDPVTAISVLSRIARDPFHGAHHDALFPILELVFDERTNIEAIDEAYVFARENFYEVGATDPELESLIHFVWGRGYYRAGQLDVALRKMKVASRSPRLAGVAAGCIRLIEQRFGGGCDGYAFCD